MLKNKTEQKTVEQCSCLCRFSEPAVLFCFLVFARSSCTIMMRGAGWALVNLRFTIYPLKRPSSAKALFI